MNVDVEQAKLSMNIFDAVVLGVFCLSAVVAFFRGFVREVLSLMAWVGAAFITIYLFPQSTQFMKQHIKSEHVAAGSAALGTYICALITLSLINSVIIRYVKTGAEVGLLDNFLGFIFGALRGAFIVSLAFLIMSSVVPKDNPPSWLKTSITKPYLQQGGDVLAKIAPRYLSNLEEIVKKQKDSQDPRLRQNEDALKKAGDTAQEKAQEGAENAQSGARRELEYMMNGTQSKETTTNGR